jgi:hypothetical protein
MTYHINAARFEVAGQLLERALPAWRHLLPHR